MGREDWYRNSAWTSAIADRFWKRLKRSRSSRNTAQYLRIQALYLAEATLHQEAIELLNRLIDDFPERFELALAHLQRSRSLQALGRPEEAIESAREALEHQHSVPGHLTDSALEFAELVLKNGARAQFHEALRQLAHYEQTSPLLFRKQRFRLLANRALLLEQQGQMAAAAAFAQIALAEDISAHPSLDVVPSDDASLAKLVPLSKQPADTTVLEEFALSQLPDDQEERELVMRLRGHGHRLDSLWDWVNGPAPSSAEPLLLEAVETVRSDRVLEAIARILTAKNFKTALPSLLVGFRRTGSESVRWAFGNAISTKHFPKRYWDEIIELATNPHYGFGRQLIVARLARVVRPETESLLISLLADPDVDAFAAGALRYCGSAEALRVLRSLDVSKSSKLMRREVGKAIIKLTEKIEPSE